MNGQDYTRYTGEEWSALYDDNGNLVAYGDHYIVDDKIAQLFGVIDIQSDDFFTPSGVDVYESLSEIPVRDDERVAELEAEVARLRAELDSRNNVTLAPQPPSGLGWTL
jgi:hypothetical protein